jgi:hypothetical protein
MKNEAMDHGLLGRIGIGEQQSFKSWEEIAKLVYQESKEGKNLYRSIISFTSQTAAELGIKSQTDWQKYIEEHISTLAEKNGIKLQNMCYAAAVHYSRTHPHVHIAFWDKSQELVKIYMDPKIANDTRKQLIKDTFAERIQEYYSEKDGSYKSMLAITEADVMAYEKYLADISEYARIEAPGWLGTEGDEINEANFIHALTGKSIMALAADLYELKEKIPKTGRIAFGFFPKVLQEDVRQVARELIENSPALKEEVSQYVNSKMNLARMYIGNEDVLLKKEKSFHDEAVDLISKRIIRTEAKIIKAEGQYDKAFDKDGAGMQYYAEETMLGIFSLLTRLARGTDSTATAHGRDAAHVDLSKEAKKERYLDAKDHGYDR